jgi:hypothetical protein
MTDLFLLATTLGFKITVAAAAYFVLLLAEAHLERRTGAFQTHLVNADPEAKAIYLGLRRLATAVLIGLCLG